MSILTSSTSITISSGVYSFLDIYNYINDINYIEKHDNYYKIKKNFYIKNTASVIDNNVNLIYTEPLLQIHKGGLLKLGTYDYVNGVISGNCSISIPNVSFAYGFGNTNKLDSGNFMMYGGIIDIPCFWGLFEGANEVEVIECKIINGFGRVSGSSTIMLNNTVMHAHGRYGGFSTKGDVSVFDKNDVYSSDSYVDATYGLLRVASYHNPSLAGNVVFKNSTYKDYDALVFIENNTGADSLTYLNCTIDGNRETSGNNTLVTLYEKYTYDINLLTQVGTFISDATIAIKDVNGVTVTNGVTDRYGKFSYDLTVYRKTPNNPGETLGPFNISITKNTDVMDYVLYINREMVNIPVIMNVITDTSGSGVDYAVIQGMLDTLKTDVCNCTNLSVTNNTSKILHSGEYISDTVSRINIFWDTISPNLKVYYKANTPTGTWIEITGLVFTGDKSYYIDNTFTLPGDYLIKVVNDINGKYIIDKIEIKDVLLTDNNNITTFA